MMHNTGIKSGSTETAAGALAVDEPQPVWMTLNEARTSAFTGEIVFEVDPEVLAYFDNGVVYYAERTSDESLGRRLLAAGVIEESQLERGTVRVGDVEHLGRLFDRDPSVDRDAVLVVAETSTQDLIADLANRETSGVRVTAYRHHPSGVHRWFVAQVDAISTVDSMGDIAPLGGSMVDDLPNMPMPGFLADELTIEWDDPFDDADVDEALASFDELAMELAADDDLVDPDALEMSISMAEFVDVVDESADEPDDEVIVELAEVVSIEPVADDWSSFDVTRIDDVAVDEGDDDDDFEFAVVWPDGQEHDAAEAESADAEMADDDTDDDNDDDVAEVLMLTPEADEVALEIPSLDVDESSLDDDTEVPDDVAAAVRRAIAAIESATIENPVVSGVAPAADQAPVVAPAAHWNAFAPPTMDMRAEVLYGLEEASTDSTMSMATAVTPVEQPVPTLAIASAGYVDDGAASESDDRDRSSALRRLIGSLRRKG